MILNETYTLENGLSIPKLGLGGLIVVDEPGAKAELGDAQADFERISFV